MPDWGAEATTTVHAPMLLKRHSLACRRENIVHEQQGTSGLTTQHINVQSLSCQTRKHLDSIEADSCQSISNDRCSASREGQHRALDLRSNDRCRGTRCSVEPNQRHNLLVLRVDSRKAAGIEERRRCFHRHMQMLRLAVRRQTSSSTVESHRLVIRTALMTGVHKPISACPHRSCS